MKSSDQSRPTKVGWVLSDFLGRVLAERTGLEPATPGVTGRYSNQLNYRSDSRCDAAVYCCFAAHRTLLWWAL